MPKIPSFSPLNLAAVDSPAAAANPAGGAGRDLRARAGGGGASGASGARGGSSSGSSGSKGSSGSSGSSGSKGSGGTSKGASGKVTVQGGRSGGRSSQAQRGAQLSAARRASLFEQRPPVSYGYGRPLAGSPALRFGFWPLVWVADVPAGAEANNDTRPGGPLAAAALRAPNDGANATYVVYADTQSVQVVLPALQATCAAVNGTAPPDLASNQTLQLYRDDSLALYRFAAASAPVNGSFEACLNATIGDNLLVASGSATGAPWALACLVALAVGLRSG